MTNFEIKIAAVEPFAESQSFGEAGPYLRARTRREREAAGDPRPSLEERYGSREVYIAKVSAVAEAVVAERLLLPTDAAAYVEAAQACMPF